MRRGFSTERAQTRKRLKRELAEVATKRGSDGKPLGAAGVAAALSGRTKESGERFIQRASSGRWYVVTESGEWRRAPEELSAQAELYAKRCETAELAGEQLPTWPARLTQLVQQFNKNS